MLSKPGQTKNRYKAAPGLDAALVREISRQKGEPDWMLAKRLAALEVYLGKPMPDWGVPLEGLDLRRLVYFVRPAAGEARRWEDVPTDIRETFEKLGIPEAERHHLSGTGAQYDSDVVYHRLQEEWANQGVVFQNMDTAVREHGDLVRRHFMSECVPPTDHKFAALHGAVWSGGTFIYIPPGVKVTLPFQAYFRMNAQRGGQFEHTLIIVDEGAEATYIEGCSAPRYEQSALHAGCVELFVRRGAKLRYISIENWSKNTFNLNTKRALVDERGTIEWLSGNLGSGRTMLYPMSVLRGAEARSDSLGIAFAGPGQIQDVGAKVIHAAPRTAASVRSKSISAGGRSIFRGLVRIMPGATESACRVQCDALVVGARSESATYPTVIVDNAASEVAHEATVGRIGEEQIFYLMSRGLTEEQATRTVVAGFVDPIIKKLPLEYAVELQRLIELEMTGSVG
ncbi:Fe-S cluster assembly protein SufB [Candidatus Uhrbacteria bacterium RIFCSPHIGHO2_02_FULL_60_10]|uniref:Fe-S cluster assembly protein SufB n=1 Tax=Candidatus Uhrbacteria bacterium RIFCSPHIGHO2_02_FULL_60_10 TaxID=1802392 RepID=A0A1F7U2B5_9BACT|nr:MAG: Fe-S cluster assembly protein SufB [Candidatus Uhrbacteria bacterium RIFCSPHIGHO2_02_FULL_60_10]